MRVETMKATESDIKRNERDYKAEPCVAWKGAGFVKYIVFSLD
jgi:hypothetical protein